MASQEIVKIFVVGGTGAQGISVISGLVQDKKYQVRVLTRNSTSPRARQLEALGNVEFIEGSFASESDLRRGYRGCDGAFINIDGFNCGEKTETYWAIRAYELAIEEGIKFFVYGNLDYGYKKSGYDPKYRCGHYDGKGRIAEWVLFQNQFNRGRMRAAVFTTGPYIEMTIAMGTPMSPTVEDGIVTWRVPLGSGAIPHVSLDDCGYYVRWMFDNPNRANGLDLEVAIEHVHYDDLARAFETVTGHPARFVDESLDSYWARGPMSRAAELGSGYNSDPSDPAFMTVRENFTGFWNLWRDSRKNQGTITRDYKLLDEIHPNRIRTVEQWFRVANEQGLKDVSGFPYLLVCALLYYVCWYFPSGLSTSADHAGSVFLIAVMYERLYTGIGQMIAAYTPNAVFAALVNPLVITTLVSFCGVMVPYSQIVAFWMYYLDPFNYLMSSLLVFTTWRKPVHCKPEELAVFDPAPNSTCGEYFNVYQRGPGIATNLLNPDDTLECRVCQYTEGGDYLRTLNLQERYYGWRNAGIVVVFVVGIYGLVFLMMKLRTKATKKAES